MINSPCQYICILENEVCIGCYRTKEEISKWRSMKDEEKQKVLERIKNEKGKE